MATEEVLFFSLNLKHDNYINNYSKTILYKLIAINKVTRMSQFLHKPLQFQPKVAQGTCTSHYQRAYTQPEVDTQLTEEKKKISSLETTQHCLPSVINLSGLGLL